MGKGNRNRLSHFEDKLTSPKKKNQSRFKMPKWATYAISLVLVVAIIASVVGVTMSNYGTVKRNRILVESQSGEFDINQQMATYLVWNTAFNYGYQLYSSSLNSSSSSTTNFLTVYAYAVEFATQQVNDYLRANIETEQFTDSLLGMVAGADKAVELGLTLNENDLKSVDAIVNELKSIYSMWAYAIGSPATFNRFLYDQIGKGMQEKDIEAAAKLQIMYQKYCNYVALDRDDAATLDDLQNFVVKNPAGHYDVSYLLYKNATPEFMAKILDKTLRAKYDELYNKLVTEEEYQEILLDLVAGANSHDSDKDDDSKKSAEALAGAFLDELEKATADVPAVWPTNTDTKTVTKPTDMEAATAIEKLLFGEKSKVAVGDKEQVDDEGTSYVIEILSGDAENGYSVKYATFTDTAYAGVLRDFFPLVETVTLTPEEFRDMVVNEIMDLNFKSVLINKYIIPVANDDMALIDEAVTALTDAEKALDTTLKALDLTAKSYASNDGKLDAYPNIKAWAFAAERAARDYATITDGEKTYLVYFFDKLADTTVEEQTVNNVSIGFVEYTAPTTSTADENEGGDTNTEPEKSNLEKLTDAVAKVKDADTKLAIALTAKGIAEKTYDSDDETFQSDFADIYNWVFPTKEADRPITGNTKVVTINNNAYLVYFFERLADTKKTVEVLDENGDPKKDENGNVETKEETVQHVSIGWCEYKYDDFGTEMKAEYDQLVSDLIADKIQKEDQANATPSEDLAKALYEKLTAKENPVAWADATKDMEKTPLTGLEKPGDKTIGLAKLFGDKLFEDTTKLKEGAFFKVDNSGTSYVIIVDRYDTETKKADITYVTIEDEDYYHFFRTLKNTLTDSFKKDATEATYPDSLTEGSFEEWLFESELNEDETERTFDRAVNDIKSFAVTTTSNNVTTKTGKYNIYVVTKEVVQDKTEDKVVFGGYLEFESKEDAQKALESLSGKVDFDLWHSFGYMTSTFTKGNDDSTDDETKQATIETDIAKDDITDKELQEWLFADARQKNDLAVIEVKNEAGDKVEKYYLAYFFTSNMTWERLARDSWIGEDIDAHIDQITADGGYELNEKAMKKLPASKNTTETE